jgi:phosphate transport system protein
MSVHLNKEVAKLKRSILQLCAMVEENVRRAVDSIARRDIQAARQAIVKDAEIDRFEIDVEEECLKILALHQPVAIDLRYVIACLKMNNDLERIGDLAVNIAKRSIAISEFADGDPLMLDFHPMMDMAQAMIKKVLDSLIELNAELAMQVMAEDDALDALNKKVHAEVNALIKSNPSKVDYYINLLSVSRHLERIGDYATNIAEDVIYLVNGRIVRHRTGPTLEEFKRKGSAEPHSDSHV